MLLASATAAHAGVIHVVTRPIEMGGGADYLVFGYDEIGNAWVEERDYNGYPQGDWMTNPRFPVPGLRFDPARRWIVLKGVVFATVMPMAAGWSVMNTGRCQLRSSIRDLGPGAPRLESVTLEVR